MNSCPTISGLCCWSLFFFSKIKRTPRKDNAKSRQARWQHAQNKHVSEQTFWCRCGPCRVWRSLETPWSGQLATVWPILVQISFPYLCPFLNAEREKKMTQEIFTEWFEPFSNFLLPGSTQNIFCHNWETNHEHTTANVPKWLRLFWTRCFTDFLREICEMKINFGKERKALHTCLLHVSVKMAAGILCSEQKQLTKKKHGYVWRLMRCHWFSHTKELYIFTKSPKKNWTETENNERSSPQNQKDQIVVLIFIPHIRADQELRPNTNKRITVIQSSELWAMTPNKMNIYNANSRLYKRRKKSFHTRVNLCWPCWNLVKSVQESFSITNPLKPANACKYEQLAPVSVATELLSLRFHEITS